MKPEDKLLLACTRQNFLETHRQTVQDICCHKNVNWDIVYSTAVQHGVAPLIYTNLQQCNPTHLSLSQDIISKFDRCFYHSIARERYTSEKLTEVLAFFNQKSIDVMLIKGAALGIMVYEQPWYTVSQDVDLIVRPRREEISEEDLAEIVTLFVDLPWFEYDFFADGDLMIRGVLPKIDFCRIWRGATKIKFREQDVFVMSPEDMLLSVCINSCRKRYFRLKALCDIAETINKYPALKWQEFAEKANAYRCNNIVYTALLATKMTLGCELPEGVLDTLTINPIRATIIRYLIQRMSLSNLASLYSGWNFFGATVDWSLLLPYATYSQDQIWRKVHYWDQVWRKKRYI